MSNHSLFHSDEDRKLKLKLISKWLQKNQVLVDSTTSIKCKTSINIYLHDDVT